MDDFGLILNRKLQGQGLDGRSLARQSNRGQLQRIRRGAYVDSQSWDSLDARTQYGMRVHAYRAVAKSEPVFSHHTAAQFWGLWLRHIPTHIHLLTSQRSGGMNKGDLMRHRSPSTGGAVRSGEFLITDKLTTVLSLITSLDFEEAVALCDSAMHSVGVPGSHSSFGAATSSNSIPFDDMGDYNIWNPGSPQGAPLSSGEIVAAIAGLPTAAARKRALAVVEVANGASGSIGESLSRVRMHLLGFETPVLQQAFRLRDGRIVFTDFYFKRSRMVGEFDGMEKYLRADWGGGKTVTQRIIAEKLREDQIRAHGVGVVRWTWAEMQNLRRFAALLDQAGVQRRQN